MKYFVLFSQSLLLALFGVTQLNAQEVDDGLSVEEMVISGHDGVRPLWVNASNNFSVLDEQQLETLQKQSLVDALRTVPGVLVNQEGGAGGVTSVSIRGAESNFTVVLLDGVPLNDPTNTRGGSFDFSNLSVHSVERVEVIRGPQSALYGSDALSGVINIITTVPQREQTNSVSVGLGENGFITTALQSAGYLENLGYAVNVGHTQSGEQVEGSEYEGTEFAAKVTTELQGNWQLDAGFRSIVSDKTSFPEQSGGPEFAESQLLDDTDGRDSTFYFSANKEVDEQWSSRLRLSWFNREAEFDSPGISPFNQVPPNLSDSDYTRISGSWLNTFQFNRNFELVFGLDFLREEGESLGSVDFGEVILPTDFELQRSLNAGFLNLHYQVVDGLNVQASIRGDDYNEDGRAVTRKLGADWSFYQDFVSVFATWGQGFKLPSFFALGNALVGNPDLQPEEAEGWDLGVHIRPHQRVLLTANYFDNDFSDLIDFDPELFVNVNRSEVSIQGVELSVDWSITEQIGFTAQGTNLDIDTGSSEVILTGRPEWSGSALVSYDYSPQLSMAANYIWNRDSFGASLHTGMTLLEELDSVQRLDMNIVWRPSSKLDLTAALNNVFDRENSEAVGFPSPGRWFRVVAKYKI